MEAAYLRFWYPCQISLIITKTLISLFSQDKKKKKKSLSAEATEAAEPVAEATEVPSSEKVRDSIKFGCSSGSPCALSSVKV